MWLDPKSFINIKQNWFSFFNFYGFAFVDCNKYVQLIKYRKCRKLLIDTFSQVKIFSGSFGGATLWENPKYVSPAKLRQAFSKKAANKYERRIEKKALYEATKPETGYPDIEEADFLKGDPLLKAEEVLVKGTVQVF